MNIFQQFYAFLHLRYAVRMADNAYKQYRHRFFVLPGEDGHLVVSDRKNFRGLRQKHWIRGADYAKMRDVIGASFYYTGYANGDGFITGSERREKTMAYFRWYEKSKREAKAKRKARRQSEKERKAKIRRNRREAKRK